MAELTLAGGALNEPLVYVVILNTNRRDDTLACIHSLQANAYRNKVIVVLDNASTDGSTDAIREAFPEVQVLGLQENLGYAGNNNVGIQHAIHQGADWVLVLNEDTLLDPQCLRLMVAEGERDSQIGIVGPLVYHADEPAYIQSAGGRLGPYWESIHIGQNDLDQGQFTEPTCVEWVSGCAILVRREVIESVGMLDERYFYYWEETEWCLRAARAGWKIVNVPAAHLWHKGVKRDYKPGPSVSYYGTRNRFLTFRKHHAPAPVWAKAWFDTTRTLVSWTVKPRWRNQRGHRDAMWRGVLDSLNQRWGKMPS